VVTVGPVSRETGGIVGCTGWGGGAEDLGEKKECLLAPGTCDPVEVPDSLCPALRFSFLSHLSYSAYGGDPSLALPRLPSAPVPSSSSWYRQKKGVCLLSLGDREERG
jgi:hypothetical protein